MANAFPQGLEPSYLWKNFDLIRSIPHGSGNEEALRNALIEWAKERDFGYKQDEVGNLLITVPGTKGMEDLPVTVIQNHIDMVCEKNADVEFDFLTEGINVELDGDFLTAIGTTLGADNGVGAAAGMAIAEDPNAAHGPLELLLTVAEETGMDGAFGLKEGFVSGKRMINLDTEEENAIYVSCAGGGDVTTRFPIEADPRPEGKVWYRIDVKGLLGGHSGLNIDENRANAIKCLARFLNALDKAEVDYRPARIEGGTMRNAIPREAGCGGCLPPENVDVLIEIAAKVEAELAEEFKSTDPDLRITVEARPNCQCPRAFTPAFTRKIVKTLMANPSSVVSMSRDISGLVETSNNLGVVRTTDDAVEIVNCTRSSVDTALESLRFSIASVYELADAEVVLEPSYPGWQPNMDSNLLKKAKEIHTDLFGEPNIKAVHAGLECGLIGKAFPGMEMISIGPDISGAHSPDERVSIPSTEKFYTFLKTLLANLDK